MTDERATISCVHGALQTLRSILMKAAVLERTKELRVREIALDEPLGPHDVRIETVFRYAHVFPRALALMGSRKIDVRALITDRYAFDDSVAAFDHACKMRPTSVTVQIEL